MKIDLIKTSLTLSGYTFSEVLSCYVNKQFFYELDIENGVLKMGVLRKGKIVPIVKVVKRRIAFRFITQSKQNVWDPKKLWLVDNHDKRIVPKHQCSQVSFKLENIEKFLLVK